MASVALTVLSSLGLLFLSYCFLALCRDRKRTSAQLAYFLEFNRIRPFVTRHGGTPRLHSRGETRITSNGSPPAAAMLLLGMVISGKELRAQNATTSAQGPATATGLQIPDAAPADPPLWRLNAFIDVGYLLDFNHPSNHLFRNRGTTPRVNELDLNMAGVSARKDVSTESRWGMELAVHAGEDSKTFGFSSTVPNISGANILRHFGRANVSYLAPVGKGLTVQAGIFSSFIGYDSLYAKDNFSYTRPWGADYTPYLMLGVNASYPLTQKLTVVGFLVNGYWHLADANPIPSFGGQVAYKATDHWTAKQTILVGPHQSDTSFELWRFLTDTTLEWKRQPLTVAFEYQAASEKVAIAKQPRATWMAAQLPVHWVMDKRWSVTVRPEVAWDSDGRWTGFPQTVKANTTTLEYRIPYRQASAILRLEHRIDNSRGPGGGFFKDGEVRPGVVALVPTQNLLTFGAIVILDAKSH